MAERLHTFSATVVDPEGRHYRVHAEGEKNELGTWNGWLVFEPQDGAGPFLRTDRETTQPDREDLVYWATGIEPIYLDGALSRATSA